MKVKSALLRLLFLVSVLSLLQVEVPGGAHLRGARGLSARCATSVCQSSMRTGIPMSGVALGRNRRHGTAVGHGYGGERGGEGSGRLHSSALGEPLPMDWQDYLTVMGHHSFESALMRRPSFTQARSMLDRRATRSALVRRREPRVRHRGRRRRGGTGLCQYTPPGVNASFPCASASFFSCRPLQRGWRGHATVCAVVLESPSRAQNPWAPATLLRGVEVGVVDLPSWNAYVGVGQPQIDGLAGASHTDVYASAEYLFGKKGNAFSGFGYKERSRPLRTTLDRLRESRAVRQCL